MTNDFEIGVIQQFCDVRPAPCVEVVNAQHIVTIIKQSLAEMGAEEASSSYHQNALDCIVMSHPCPPATRDYNVTLTQKN